MKRILVLVAMLGVGCGKARDRGDCGVSTDCPVGQYCAHTADGNVCWADAVPPSVSSVTVTCSTAPACMRDAVLHVEANASDDDEVLDASATLDLAPGQPIAMTRVGGKWVADVALRAFPFDAFARDVVATVTARDGARNVGAPMSGAAVPVTRLRWTYDAGAPITSPAVMDDGTAVVGVSATSNQVLAVRADGTKAWSLTIGGTSFVTAAPAVGARAIWVGSEDFSLHAVRLDGTGVLSNVGVDAGGGIRGSVAVRSDATKEWGIATSATGFVGAASTVANEHDVSGQTDPFAAGPVIGLDGNVYAATAVAAATVRSYGLTTTPTVSLAEKWNVNVGSNVTAPLALDLQGNVWSGSMDTTLWKTVPSDLSGTASSTADLVGSVLDSAVILPNGDVIVGDQGGDIHRLSFAGSELWSPVPNLSGSVLAPLLLTDTGPRFVIPTANGKVYALADDGQTRWSATLANGIALRAGNIYTPPGQAALVMSTAYFSAANGTLYAVIVDGQLDASAPWPKAFHDPKNTNRAGPQP